MNTDTYAEPDLSAVKFIYVDYFGTQGKSWATDEAKTVQDLLGHRYQAGDYSADCVDPKLRRLLDTTNLKDPAQFLRSIASELGCVPVTGKTLAGFLELLERVKALSSDFKDTIPGLEGLKRKGYALGVMSNLWALGVEHVFFNHDQLHRYFRELVFSFEIGHVKPEAEMFEAGAVRANFPLRNILLVDDDLEFVRAAQQFGMQAVLIDRFGKYKEGVPGVLKIRYLTDLPELLPTRDPANAA